MSEISVFKGRKLSAENAKLIGSGAASNVYMLSEDTVVKVLKRGDLRDAEREILLSKWALTQGIPTAISYDVVEVDGHPGLVYESLGRGNLRNEFRDHPERFDETMKKYVALLRTINSVTVEDAALPKAIDRYREYLDGLRETLTEAEYFRMKRMLDTIPDSKSLVHGDCQVKNVRVVGDELLLIDLDTLSCGDAIFELSGLYCCYKAYQEPQNEEFDTFFELPAATLRNVLNVLLRDYYEGLTEEQLAENEKKIALLSYMYMSYLGLIGDLSSPEAADAMLRSFREYLPQVDDLILKK